MLKTMKNEFEIKIKNSPLPEDETRSLLWQCFDLLFANAAKRKDKNPIINPKTSNKACHNSTLLTKMF